MESQPSGLSTQHATDLTGETQSPGARPHAFQPQPARSRPAPPEFPWEIPIVSGILWLACASFFVFVVPVFERIFAGFQAKLPAPTVFVILQSKWYFLILQVVFFIIAATVGVVAARRLEMKPWMRVAGALAAMVAVAVFLILCTGSLYLPVSKLPTIIKGG